MERQMNPYERGPRMTIAEIRAWGALQFAEEELELRASEACRFQFLHPTRMLVTPEWHGAGDTLGDAQKNWYRVRSRAEHWRWVLRVLRKSAFIRSMWSDLA